jgi:DNA processing protein
MGNVSHERLAALFLLQEVKGFGPQKFKMLHRDGIPPEALVREPGILPLSGITREKLIQEIAGTAWAKADECRMRAERQLAAAEKHQSRIITYEDPLYPQLVHASNYPIPVIFAKGNTDLLHSPRNVACVGSRGIREPYVSAHLEFARIAIECGFVIVSGFATGADTVGHRAPLEFNGYTICVMPAGLQRPFPPENTELWERLLETGRGLFVSESAFGVRASRLTLQKRNKLIVAFSLAVMLSQTSEKGGAMNAYRFALEQKKPVATFAADASPETAGNQFIIDEGKGECYRLALPADKTEVARWLTRPSSLI